MLVRLVKQLFPQRLREWLRASLHGQAHVPGPGHVRFGALRRLTPFSHNWGFDRGQPLDRYYIERFLAEHAKDVRGHALEIEHDMYTRRYGGDRVTKRDVLYVEAGHPRATIVADLTRADHIASNTFDVIIFTQTLPFIYDTRGVIATLYRILKPGGVVLATTPGVCHQISRHDMERWGDYWRFTSLAATRLFTEAFSSDLVHVRSYGNVLVAAGVLYGVVAEDLRAEELEYWDADYEVLIGVRAQKPNDG